MGYRSSMPIIELKLTGPDSQREAMLALWPEVKRVAGQNMILKVRKAYPRKSPARCKNGNSA